MGEQLKCLFGLVPTCYCMGWWPPPRGPCRSPGTGRRRSTRWRSGWPAWPCGWLPAPTGWASSPAGHPWRSPDTHTEWQSYLRKNTELRSKGQKNKNCCFVTPLCVCVRADLAAGWLRWWWGWTVARGTWPGRLRSRPRRRSPCRRPGWCRWTPGWTGGAWSPWGSLQHKGRRKYMREVWMHLLMLFFLYLYCTL